MTTPTAVSKADITDAFLNRPLRDELLSPEGLEAHARLLAGRFGAGFAPPGTGRDFHERLTRSAPRLRDAYRKLAADAAGAESPRPAAEWLLDNFHLVESEIADIRRNLPRRFIERLPAVTGGEHAGRPRIQALAVELLRHSDSSLDLGRLIRFISAYQTLAPLTIGELWAWPTFLKAELVENIHRLGEQLMVCRTARLAADRFIREFEAGSSNANPPVLPDPLPAACVAQLLERFREFGPKVAGLRARLAERLAARGLTAEDALRAEHLAQAAEQTSMANSITSLRLCSTLDWNRNFERVSLVEQTLRRDPAGIYPAMDFGSRNRYREAVEAMAGPTGESEIGVALKAVELARRGSDRDPGDARAGHVGNYITGPGCEQLEAEVGRPPRGWKRLRRAAFQAATPLYLGSILVLTAILISLALRLIPGGDLYWSITALLVIPATELAIGIIQWLVPLLARPRRLPRLDLRDGIPEAGRTMVIIPTLLTSVEGVRDLLDHLEVQALANDTPRIHFALVTDFADAPKGEMPGDAAILEAARAGILELNTRRGPSRTDQFHLLHRGRRWNPREECWMGWERKRGKIEEFNRYIRGDLTTGFEVHVGEPTILQKIRLCITLDSDTRLPRGAARQLIGIALHPLNRPRFDPKTGRIVQGYGILQPRVSVTMSSVAGSLFSRVYAGHTGVDPYTTAVSDVYQDLFGEGNFTGKGLYDVDALTAALDGRVPPNMLLSHDLFEGVHARTALVTDVEVVDDYPSNVVVHTRRQHRWVRGDWQILLWLLPWVPRLGGLGENRLPLISRWKILDNLRRSLVAPSLLVLLAMAWTVFPGSALGWTLAALGVLAFPVYQPLIQALRGPGPGQSWRHFSREIDRELNTALAQTLMSVTFLAYHAYRMTHAIILTLVRVLITRQRLLEWEPAAFVSRLFEGRGIMFYVVEMGMSPIMALFLFTIIVPLRVEALPAAVPFLLLWALAPILAYRWSQPARVKEFDPSEDERAWLHRLAKRTWDYFDHYMTAENNWLPPDNMQEVPIEMVARRTSPTNIGLGLLSTLAANDLGFLSDHGLAERLEGAMDTIERLEHHQGHLLNWYETVTLVPLHPYYVSTVDSGNLAGAYLALEAGLREKVRADIAGPDLINPGVRRRLVAVADRCEVEFEAMNFTFLFDRERKLFTIGYRLADREGPGRPDIGYYDLLASEARLASYIAIAKGDVPEEHWFHLGRLLVDADGLPTLVSWSASMFEYLMPLLLLKNYPGTMLDASCRGAVAHQIQFAARQGIPWGISESGYPLMDRVGQYQYKAFGVPGVGLKRGLGEELVVAPYATFLAAQVDLEESLRNLKRLAHAGLEGRYGFYEAIDFTRDASAAAPNEPRSGSRPGVGPGVIVRSFLAHHQGMTLLALANVLQKGVMQRRFHADPRIQATELLLQERLPRRVSIGPMRPAEETRAVPVVLSGVVRRFRSAHTSRPQTHFLSNGTYTAFITNAGGGASLCRGRAVTRLREDVTCDAGSQYLYLRDVRSGRTWSAAHLPIGGEPSEYLVTFELEKAGFHRIEDDIETRMEITVSPEDDMEVRRLTITNRSGKPREIEVTSYVEFALAAPAEDLVHPAFHRLFLETTWLPDSHAILVARRPRAEGDPTPCGVHVLGLDGRLSGPVEWETDRSRFLGAGRSAADPVALETPLVGTAGAVLDPIASLRVRLRLPAGGFARLAFSTGMADSNAAAAVLADKYRDPAAATRAFSLACARSQIELRHLGLSRDEAQLYQRLASLVLGADGALQADADTQARNEKGQPDLWSFGISGDVPILLVRVVEENDLPLVRQVLKAQEYWHLKNLSADVVILNEHSMDYRDEMHHQLETLLESGSWAGWRDRPGGVFLLRSDGMTESDGILLACAARAILRGDRGELADQVQSLVEEPNWPAPFAPTRAVGAPDGTSQGAAPSGQTSSEDAPLDPPSFAIPHGLGGFTGGDHPAAVMLLDDAEDTPTPWVNILANPTFGTLITTTGSAFTWSESSRQNRLTPFANDPVSRPTGEAVYLRDDETGDFWSATPAPMPHRTRRGRWIVSHEAGRTSFRHRARGLDQEFEVVVDPEAPLKYGVVSLTNRGSLPRQISLMAWNDWVLGPSRPDDHRHIITESVPDLAAILARNPWNRDFPGRVAFAALSESAASVTGDRLEFLGRNGSTAAPAALARRHLSGRVGAGLDPGAGLHVVLDIPPGATRRVSWILGQAASRESALELVTRHRPLEAADRARESSRRAWSRRLLAIQVSTPDDSFDLLVNRWLVYQNLACRIWARSGFYQPGGAYGFRDQLQDVIALLHTAPEVAREHLIRAAGRQFVEGDAQHWWHPHDGRGMRTRCSDDFLWLPWAAVEYVRVTGDASILDVVIPYLEAPLLEPGESESYRLPSVSAQTGSLFDHCLRAVDRGLTAGPHGLPLIGSGDWNDGMNRVGIGGRGESVWLGWFFHVVLGGIASLCQSRGQDDRAHRYQAEARRLAGALEQAWDGHWYRRGYFDDGTPLGSAQNDECRIDSISQSWAVLSGAAPPHRAESAMDAVRAQLVRRAQQIVLLLTPPFDQSAMDPGYIKGYVPGIRENGGQYTHAAVWTAMAIARLGNGEEAVELFHLLNPINHSRTAADTARYKTEPWAVAADVYGHPLHVGRGGWTWYTGSAGWLYRLGIESILGLTRHGSEFKLDPCIPASWPRYSIDWRVGSSHYAITVENPDGECRGVREARLDGRIVDPRAIPLVDDGKRHSVTAVMGSRQPSPGNGGRSAADDREALTGAQSTPRRLFMLSE